MRPVGRHQQGPCPSGVRPGASAQRKARPHRPVRAGAGRGGGTSRCARPLRRRTHAPQGFPRACRVARLRCGATADYSRVLKEYLFRLIMEGGSVEGVPAAPVRVGRAPRVRLFALGMGCSSRRKPPGFTPHGDSGDERVRSSQGPREDYRPTRSPFLRDMAKARGPALPWPQEVLERDHVDLEQGGTSDPRARFGAFQRTRERPVSLSAREWTRLPMCTRRPATRQRTSLHSAPNMVNRIAGVDIMWA